MKKIVLSLLVLISTICLAQTPKPDLAALTMNDNVKLTIKGLNLENKISQDKLVEVKQLDLKGDEAAKYKIAYYHFKTTYKRSISQNDEFYNNEITPTQTQFFTDLETNCRLMFEDVVIQELETGKQYKIAPLTVVVKVE
jgi:hypothetical protein